MVSAQLEAPSNCLYLVSNLNLHKIETEKHFNDIRRGRSACSPLWLCQLVGI